MKNMFCYGKKLQNLLFRVNPFFTYIIYFLSLSFVGFGVLKSLKPRAEFSPRNIDLFFTSVSAATVSSMSTVEMEVLSNAQLIVMTILMFTGGEIFTSMIGLHLSAIRASRKWDIEGKIESVERGSSSSRSHRSNTLDQIGLSIVTIPHNLSELSQYSSFLKNDSIKFLGYVVLCYFLGIQIVGIVSVLVYIALIPSAKNVLQNKGIKTATFAVFTVVSTFASCGFVPTNENMIVFSKNSGLLLILIPQIPLGNTLFPSGLRSMIWIVGKKMKKMEVKYLLENTREAGYHHLLSGLYSGLLVVTVLGFTLIGFALFCSLEWDSAGLDGLNVYQKVVGVIFECFNARHTGETIVDLSTIAPAVLVFFIVMMLASLSTI